MIAPMNLLKVWAVVLVWGAAQLASGGSITGTIRLPGGRPAAGMRVAAMAVPGVGRSTTDSSEYVRITQTDTNGRYQLEDIPPGRYFIVAGPVSAPTFHPGKLEQTGASIVTVSKTGPALTGIDFGLEADIGNFAYGFAPGLAAAGIGGCCRFSAQLVTEDGSRFPDVPMKAGNLRGSLNAVFEGSKGVLSFAVSVPIGSTAQFDVVGLPPGYFLKSVELGGRDVGLGPVVIDGKSLATLVLTAGYLPVSTLQKVTARGKVVNIAREVRVTSVSFTSTNPTGPTLVSELRPDGTFEFPSIPIGVYRPSLFSNLLVIPDSNLTIDLHNNPFPESDPQSVFTGGKKTTITGVVTEKLTFSGHGYFRMNVKNESTGAVTPWAIYVAADWLVPKIVVGDTLSVPGTLSTDGTNRLSADEF